jgi:hypothetical protein
MKCKKRKREVEIEPARVEERAARVEEKTADKIFKL